MKGRAGPPPRGVRALLAPLARRQSLGRAGALLALIRVAGLGCVFLLQVMLARLLGSPASYGSYAWGQSLLFLLGGVAALGMPVAAARLIAVLDDRGDVALSARILTGARWNVAVAGLALLAAAALLALAMPDATPEGLSRAAIVVALAGAPAVAWMNLNQHVARARGRLATAALPVQVLRPLLTGLLVALVGWQFGGTVEPMTCLGLLLASILTVTLVQERALHRKRPAGGDATRQNEDAYGPRQLLRIGLAVLSTRVAVLVMQYASTLLLGVLAGPAAAGAYFAATRLAELAGVPGQVVSAVTQPLFARSFANEPRPVLERQVWSAMHLAFWPTLVTAGAFFLLSGPVLGLFGRDFAMAGPVLALLLLARLVGASLGPSYDVLVMSGNQRPLATMSAIGAVAHVALLLLLLPRFGALGAALTECASTVLLGVCRAVVARRRAGVRTTLFDAIDPRRRRHGEGAWPPVSDGG